MNKSAAGSRVVVGDRLEDCLAQRRKDAKEDENFSGFIFMAAKMHKRSQREREEDFEFWILN